MRFKSKAFFSVGGVLHTTDLFKASDSSCCVLVFIHVLDCGNVQAKGTEGSRDPRSASFIESWPSVPYLFAARTPPVKYYFHQWQRTQLVVRSIFQKHRSIVLLPMATSVQSRSRVFPDSFVPSPQPKVESLSIIDALVLHFAKTSCIWFYNDSLDTGRLISSLRKTLNAYPQWAGQLRFAEYSSDAGHLHRQGRLELSHGSSTDPGVECILAEADFPMSAMLPPDEATKHWNATHVDYDAFLDMETEFALHDSKTCEGLPSMKVQLTTFKDGGMAYVIISKQYYPDSYYILSCETCLRSGRTPEAYFTTPVSS